MVQAQHIVLHANPAWSARASKISDVLQNLKRAAHMPGEPVASAPEEEPVIGVLLKDDEPTIKQKVKELECKPVGNTTVTTKGMASGHADATPVNGELLLELCSRMRHALSIRDERSAYGFMESARAMAGAVLNRDDFAVINRAAIFIEADMDNGLWESAIKSGRLFTDAVSQAIQNTNKRN